jgi:hypothetical protein
MKTEFYSPNTEPLIAALSKAMMDYFESIAPSKGDIAIDAAAVLEAGAVMLGDMLGSVPERDRPAAMQSTLLMIGQYMAASMADPIKPEVVTTPPRMMRH